MQNKRIINNNQKLSYVLRKNRRSRCIRLIVHSDRSITVTAPARISESVINRFVEDKTDWIISKMNSFGETKSKEDGRKEYLENKEKARSLVLERLSVLNEAYSFKFNSVSIKNQRTCWGSCSKKGNLNFNYKLLFLPEKARDYVIVHELCHLKELNHSRRFWDLVGKTFPDHRRIRSDLRKHSINLQ